MLQAARPKDFTADLQEKPGSSASSPRGAEGGVGHPPLDPDDLYAAQPADVGRAQWAAAKRAKEAQDKEEARRMQVHCDEEMAYLLAKEEQEKWVAEKRAQDKRDEEAARRLQTKFDVEAVKKTLEAQAQRRQEQERILQVEQCRQAREQMVNDEKLARELQRQFAAEQCLAGREASHSRGRQEISAGARPKNLHRSPAVLGIDPKIVESVAAALRRNVEEGKTAFCTLFSSAVCETNPTGFAEGLIRGLQRKVSLSDEHAQLIRRLGRERVEFEEAMAGIRRLEHERAECEEMMAGIKDARQAAQRRAAQKSRERESAGEDVIDG